MWQHIASFVPPPYIKERIDSIKTVIPAWGFDNFNYTNLDEAFGTAVNCDYYPLQITQLPTGFTAQSLVEYFRKNLNSYD
jgi:amino acid permease